MADISWIAFNQVPQWFSILTTTVQTLGILVSFFISYLGFKGYKLTEDRKYKYFFYGFLFMGLSFLANMVLNILIRAGFASFFVEQRYNLLIAPLFGIYYFFLIGLLIAYLSLSIVYFNIKTTKRVWLLYLWTFVIGAYSFREAVLFNIFAAILISFVVFETFEKYRESTKIKNRLMTFLAFLSLFIFHISILLNQDIILVVIARYVVLLIGLVLLLIPLLKIFYGRTKK